MPPNNTSFAYANSYSTVVKSLSWLGWRPDKKFNIIKATPGFLASFTLIVILIWSAYANYQKGLTDEALTLVAGCTILKLYNLMFLIVWQKSDLLVEVFDEIDHLTNDCLKETGPARTKMQSDIDFTKKLIRYTMMALYTVCITLPAMWLVGLVVRQIKGKQDNMYVPFHISLPGDLHNLTPYNEILNIYLCVTGVFCSMGFGGWSGLIFSQLFFIKTQFDLVSVKVKDLFDDLEPENYVGQAMAKLTVIIERHQRVIRLKELIEDWISFYIGLLQFYVRFILCVCAFIIMNIVENGAGSMQAFLILPTALFIIFVLCKLGTEIVDANMKIGIAVYNCNWESYPSITIGQTLMIIMMRSQTPLQITGFGIVVLDMSTFTVIVNTAYTYFTFLRST